ncbi:hypothetical protein [Streptomyces sp. NPDC005012]|uniref:hypothetical protein n=1 Tax=Streptomyces sp. NPDC005012 TaxID=3154558 RepID=UPI0033B3AB2D
MSPHPRRRNEALAQLLTEADLTSAELARRVNRLAAAHGVELRYDRTSVAHWLAGSRPQAFVAQVVAEILTRRTGRLVAATETGLLRERAAGRTESTPAPVPPDPLSGLVALARTDTEPKQRSELRTYVYQERRAPDARRPRPAADEGRTGAEAKVGAADVHRAGVVADQFYANWIRFGGAHARGALASYLGDDIGGLLAQAVLPEVRVALVSVTARLAYILAGASADAGLHGLAQRYHLLALDAAAEGGDDRTRAMTLRSMSVQALRMRAPRYAVELADAAVTAVGRTQDGDLRAFVLVQRAHARAVAGEHDDARRDLSAAERSLGRTASGDGPFARYSPAGFAYRSGQVLHRLGHVQPALAALRSAAETRAEHENCLRALSQARLALVLLDQGLVDEACLYGRLFAKEYPALRSHRATLMSRELRARLARFRRHPGALDVLRILSALDPQPATAQH